MSGGRKFGDIDFDEDDEDDEDYEDEVYDYQSLKVDENEKPKEKLKVCLKTNIDSVMDINKFLHLTILELNIIKISFPGRDTNASYVKRISSNGARHAKRAPWRSL